MTDFLYSVFVVYMCMFTINFSVILTTEKRSGKVTGFVGLGLELCQLGLILLCLKLTGAL